MMHMVDHLAICVETPKIESMLSLEEGFTKLICMNSQMVLYLNINQDVLCHDSISDP